MSNAEAKDLFEFDESVLDDELAGASLDDGPSYPIVQWRKGDPKMKALGKTVQYHGGWFIPDDAGLDGELLEAAGWVKDSFITGSDDEITGYAATVAEMQVINKRRRWRVGNTGFAWKDYDAALAHGKPLGERPSGQMHIMVRIRGLEDVGPLVLTLSGHAGMAFNGDREYSSSGVLKKMGATIRRAANERSKKTSKRHWPELAFFAPVGVHMVKGVPQFREVGPDGNKSKIVVPVLVGVPDDWKEVDLKLYFAGTENIDAAKALYAESLPWVQAWDSIDPSGEEETHGTAAPAQEEDDAVIEEEIENLAL